MRAVINPRDVFDAEPVRLWENPKSKPWCVRVVGKKGETLWIGQFKTRAKAQQDADKICEYAASVNDTGET